MGATCFAPRLIHGFAAFAASWPVQSGSHSFLGSPREGATCLAVGLMTIFAAFAASLPVQGGSRSFLGSFGKSATCLAQGGSRFSSSGQVFTSFPRLLRLSD